MCKEEIAGLLTALELFVDTDFDAQTANWRAKSILVAERLSDIPGVVAEMLEARPSTEDILSTLRALRFDLLMNTPAPPKTMF